MISQRIKVLNHLLKHEEIDEDVAKKMKIGRLSVMIERLRKEGYIIDTLLENGVRKVYLLRK
jgi:DNA-binding PadR family transcriptional regulator